MQGKAKFWLGLALSVVGVIVIFFAGNRVAAHLSGAGVVLVGLVLALRNARD